MNFFKKIFKKKAIPDLVIETYEDFWKWFVIHEKEFFSIVKKGGGERIESQFFAKIGPKLNELKSGIFYLTGVLDDTTVDLILTADGNIANFYVIEELVAASPELENWKFRAHKPSAGINGTAISMGGFDFSSENMSFYANDLERYPDEIDITIVHDDYTEATRQEIINGSYIFLDNFLGEIQSITIIDNIKFLSKKEASKELVPIGKLESFLIWREKEFIEKYEGVRRDTENDTFSSMEATLKNGYPFIAIINTDLLAWEAKASHPWILRLEIKYIGNEKGMPNTDDYKLLNVIEDEIDVNLKDYEGYLNIGRETASNSRNINYACKNYIKPAKISDVIKKKYADDFEISFEIYKDKYWQTFEKFIE